VLGLGAATVVASVASACDVLSTEPDDGRNRNPRRGGDEVPMLADRVKAGELPPLAERLPDKPLVMDPVERIGEYGMPGVHPDTVRNVELGHRRASQPLMTAWARALGLDPLDVWQPPTGDRGADGRDHS